ncbi:MULTISPECIES: stage V sporulation protein AE [Fictibacillus]|jgi:stage V sporulation protein AE|uniref:stage V sporulation protein AE n=1 Tax=Fictibacillus TaxID=1329200 RepID=UPI0018CD7FD4|nr:MULTISPECIES: stage V sporulation protein AE [unclassified Fictibacillus]MBH0157523.1 stage V sporulation protein AE [Fictibacillus sp. 5RED26]MBH0160245.1 stage V sporulation protein AE [Fictibacillus sp. 26RED30]MBH0166536.1 stage V sporulation protein AE [Fictibacillus sp. 7GRE50]MBH0174454.1 stage V sporulation protein AE [Fictibacillus sp. 23RED33]
MEFFWAFLVGGAICVVGQLMMDVMKLTPAHVTTSFVVIGALLDAFGIYDNLIKFAGAGATVPITSFGHSLLHGAMASAEEHGFIGIAMGIFELTSAGISSAVLFGFLVAVIFEPKG